MFGSLDISASALSAQRIRMNVVANNLANVNTTRDASGRINPYRRKLVLFQPGADGLGEKEGVKVVKVVEDMTPFRRQFEPGHPDAGKDGYVSKPNVFMVEEMVDMMEATRAYEANVTAMDASKRLYNNALRIIA